MVLVVCVRVYGHLNANYSSWPVQLICNSTLPDFQETLETEKQQLQRSLDSANGTIAEQGSSISQHHGASEEAESRHKNAVVGEIVGQMMHTAPAVKFGLRE